MVILKKHLQFSHCKDIFEFIMSWMMIWVFVIKGRQQNEIEMCFLPDCSLTGTLLQNRACFGGFVQAFTFWNTDYSFSLWTYRKPFNRSLKSWSHLLHFPHQHFSFFCETSNKPDFFFLFYRWAFQLHKSVKEWFFLVVASFVTSVSFRTEMEICAVQTISRFFFMFIKGSHIYARLNKSDKKRDAYALFLLLCKCMHICESTEFCIWSLGCCSVHLFPACHCIVWKSLWLVAFQTV